MSHDSVYTGAPIREVMLKTALAMIPATLAMSGYNLADTYFVGRLPGAAPLAAMGFTFPVIMLVGCVFRGLANGVMTTAAHALGAGKRASAAKLISAGLLIVFAASLLLAVGGMVTVRWVFGLCGAEGEALEMACGYMNIWYWGCATAALSMTGSDLLVGSGHSKLASVAMILGMLINVGLDPVFIFGWGPIPGGGIRGAAIATVLSQLLSTVLVLWLLTSRYRLLQWHLIPWRTLKRAAGMIGRFAIPAILGMLMIPIASGVLTRITANFGDVAVAAAAAAGRIEMVAFVVPMSLGIGLTPFIAQNFGARRYDRIEEGRRFAMRFALFFLLCSAAVITLFYRSIVEFFAVDVAVQQIMASYLLIVSWGLWGVEIHRFGGFIFTGCGRPAVAAWLNVLRIAGFLIPFSLVALYCHSLTGLFVARLAADVCAAAVAYGLVRRMTRRLPTVPAGALRSHG